MRLPISASSAKEKDPESLQCIFAEQRSSDRLRETVLLNARSTPRTSGKAFQEVQTQKKALVAD